jgi:site-specific DNA-methyltransferase (adenine-specific)
MTLIQADCLAWMRKQPAKCVDFVFGSPPYAEKGERYNGAAEKWSTVDWVAWMLQITQEAVRLCRGYSVWIVNGAVVGGRYFPACEGLLWEANKQGIRCERPAIWHKNPPPNRRDWFVNAWEYCLAFRPVDGRPFFDWQAVAEPPKYTSGGRFRQRDRNGNRRAGNTYPTNKLARPRDVVYVTVGGGHMGHPLAHENEAPFPLRLAEHFIRACCPLGGTVLDPFIGSGTTAHAAENLGRRWIGVDLRESQIALTGRRLGRTTATETGGAP